MDFNYTFNKDGEFSIMYAIQNEVGDYLRVINTDYKTFLVAFWSCQFPIQTVTLETANKMLDHLKSNPVLNWDGEGKFPKVISI